MLLFTTVSGACILAGGLLARVERIRPLWLEQELRHTVIAFGGGVLIAAIAFVLVPEGLVYFDAPLWGGALFLAGGLVFQDIAPQSHLEQRWAPALGAVLGFCFAMLAEIVVKGP